MKLDVSEILESAGDPVVVEPDCFSGMPAGLSRL